MRICPLPKAYPSPGGLGPWDCLLPGPTESPNRSGSPLLRRSSCQLLFSRLGVPPATSPQPVPGTWVSQPPGGSPGTLVSPCRLTYTGAPPLPGAEQCRGAGATSSSHHSPYLPLGLLFLPLSAGLLASLSEPQDFALILIPAPQKGSGTGRHDYSLNIEH